MRIRAIAVAVLAAATAALGVGCTAPSEGESQNIGNWLGLSIILSLCQYTSFCPIPGDPPAPVAPAPDVPADPVTGAVAAG